MIEMDILVSNIVECDEKRIHQVALWPRGLL